MTDEPASMMTIEEFLQDPAHYGDGAQTIETITTHGAKIFLGKEDVFKIKRPIDLGYMDFTSLKKRRDACNREVELNRDVAPTVYIETLPVFRLSDGDLTWERHGEPCEWVIHMKRYPQRDVLNEVAGNGELSEEIARALGKVIADQHHGLRPAVTSGGAKRIGAILEGLHSRLAELDPIIPRGITKEFKTQSSASHASVSEALEERARLGMIRRCHGDLHLRNIVLLDGKAVPIDALEFDEELATTDVLYDLAFLIMDLHHVDLHDRANLVLNRYCLNGWELVKDHGFEVFPLFLSIRAAIRAMVEAQRLSLVTGHERRESAGASDYLAEATGYLAPQPLFLVAVGGLSGTGKSTLAATLASVLGGKCGALHLRSDLERKALFDTEEFKPLPPEAYDNEANAMVYETMAQKARTALKQGFPVILDAVFADRRERETAEDLANELGVDFAGLWLHAPDTVLAQRVRERQMDASDATEDVLRLQLQRHPDVMKSLSEAWKAVDASGGIIDTRNRSTRILNTMLAGANGSGKS